MLRCRSLVAIVCEQFSRLESLSWSKETSMLVLVHELWDILCGPCVCLWGFISLWFGNPNSVEDVSMALMALNFSAVLGLVEDSE